MIIVGPVEKSFTVEDKNVPTKAAREDIDAPIISTLINFLDHCDAMILGIIRKELINTTPTDFIPTAIINIVINNCIVSNFFTGHFINLAYS